MTYQASFAELEYRVKKRLTRRECFLKEMVKTIPWSKLIECIESHYPTTGRRGRQPIALSAKFRIYCMQN